MRSDPDRAPSCVRDRVGDCVLDYVRDCVRSFAHGSVRGFTRASCVALSCLVLSLVSCGRDRIESPDPTSPHETVVAEGTLGASGGELSGDSVVLQVPAGALSEESLIRIVRSDGPNPLGPEVDAPLYRLEGIPESPAQPIHLRLRRSADARGDLAVAYGEETFAPSFGDLSVGYHTLPGTFPADAEWMELELPAATTVATAATVPAASTATPAAAAIATTSGPALDRISPRVTRWSDPTATIFLSERITGNTLRSAAGHFEIDYGGALVSRTDVEALASYLEEAYARFLTLGFDYSARQRWPVEVTVLPLGAEVYGYYYSAKRGDDYGYMEFNSSTLSNHQELRVSAGHEFFHLVQALYDPRPPREQAKTGGPQYWLDEAAAVSSEPSFSDDPTFHSVVRQSTWFVPFAGAPAGLETASPQGYGYGNALLFRYLQDRWGVTIVSLYERVRAGLSPFAAIEDATPESISTWWPDYMDHYVTGDLSTDVSRTGVEGQRSLLWSIESAADTLSIATDEIGALGTGIYLVRPKYAQIDESASLRIDTSGGNCDVRVYEVVESSGLVRRASGQGSVVVDGLREITARSARLVVSVTNCAGSLPDFGGADHVSVYFRVVHATDLSRFDTISIYLRYHALWETGSGGTIDVPLQGLGFLGHLGAFQDNVFHATWDSTGTDGVHEQGAVTVTLNPIDLSVVGWEASARKEYGTTGSYDTFRMTGEGLGPPELVSGILVYGANGEATCSYITSIHVERWVQGALDRRIDDTYSCEASSYLDFRFHDEVPNAP